ncbi:hypothetical protein [Roseovarius sp. Pro17]|uniref:hypothetical protein n=1 Tax=Roseovarius sp. Pro17 TaxID=3108175 RepID=UPI002D78DAAC|nr:hypothetical protein [Roseovarius sp. Pro17]
MTSFSQTHRQRPSAGRRSTGRDWRCQKCCKLLGCCSDGGVHVNFARGHQYIVSTPVAAICRRCGTLNEIHKTT